MLEVCELDDLGNSTISGLRMFHGRHHRSRVRSPRQSEYYARKWRKKKKGMEELAV